MTESTCSPEDFSKRTPWKLDLSFPKTNLFSEMDANFAAVFAHVMIYHPDAHVYNGQLPLYVFSLGCGTLPRDPFSIALCRLPDGRKPPVRYVGVDPHVESDRQTLEMFWGPGVVQNISFSVIPKYGQEIELGDLRGDHNRLPNVLLIRSPDFLDLSREESWAKAIRHVLDNNFIAPQSLIIVTVDGDYMAPPNRLAFWNEFNDRRGIRRVSSFLRSDPTNFMTSIFPEGVVIIFARQ